MSSKHTLTSRSIVSPETRRNAHVITLVLGTDSWMRAPATVPDAFFGQLPELYRDSLRKKIEQLKSSCYTEEVMPMVYIKLDLGSKECTVILSGAALLYQAICKSMASEDHGADIGVEIALRLHLALLHAMLPRQLRLAVQCAQDSLRNKQEFDVRRPLLGARSFCTPNTAPHSSGTISTSGRTQPRSFGLLESYLLQFCITVTIHGYS